MGAGHVVVAAALIIASASAADLIGNARVIDGDTIEISGEKIRLHGIDAPELRQVCERDGRQWNAGEDAANWLRELIGSDPVICHGNERDKYRRLIAVCKVNGLDLGEAMVRAGMAFAYRRFSDRYSDDEQSARGDGVGLWAGRCAEPWETRQNSGLN